MSNLASAVETAPVSSLHSFGSANPDDFAVPTGREEEWRFTPLNRLRALHKDAAFTGAVTVAVEAAPEVVVETEDLSERKRLAPSGGFLPTDRVSARAYAAAVGRATVLTVPKDTTAPPRRPTSASPAPGTDAAAAGHLVIDVQPYGRATVVIDQTGSATYASNVEIHVADGGDLTVVALADWADDAVQVAHHQITLGKDAHVAHFAVTLGGSLVRLSPDRQVRRARRRRRAARHHVRRRGPAPGEPGCSSTTTRRTAAAASATRARCPARARAPCGSATC